MPSTETALPTAGLTLHRGPHDGRPGFLVLTGPCQFGTAWAGLRLISFIRSNSGITPSGVTRKTTPNYCGGEVINPITRNYYTRDIELVRPGIARSRVCAPPHAHINSQGSRPSLCGVHNVEVLGASGTKKSRFGAWKVKSLVLAEFKLRRNAPSTHTLRWRSVRRVRVAHEPVLPQGGGRGTLEGASNGRHSYETDF